MIVTPFVKLPVIVIGVVLGVALTLVEAAIPAAGAAATARQTTSTLWNAGKFVNAQS